MLIPIFSTAQGSVLLVGGGGEEYNDWSDRPYRWLVDHAPNKRILVLHYSTGSAWLQGYFTWLGADTASSLVISTTQAANDSAVYRAILKADGLFLRGGDQYQYVSKWKGTLAEQAIREVFQRGGVVGGTSAGAAVLSQLIFDARLASVDPRTALRNPSAAGITFTEGFLGFAPGLLADTHFFERGRISRLAAMVAMYRLQSGKDITGAGIDYNTALAVGPDGKAEVMGAGTVTLLRNLPSTSFVLKSAEQFSLRSMRCDQLTDSAAFDLLTGTVTLPASSVAFHEIPFSHAAGPLMLDGSGLRSDWYSSVGSLKALTELHTPLVDTVVILSSMSTPSVAMNIDSCLTQWNVPSRIVWLNGASAHAPGTAASIASAGAIILAGNNADSIHAILGDSTPAGAALRTRLAGGTTALFFGNDAVLAAAQGVGKLEQHPYGAYYGEMSTVQGIGLLNGITIVPRLFENSDYTDNRTSGMFWSLALARSAFGLLMDAGTTVTLEKTRLRVAGRVPVLLLDARSISRIAFPTWIHPGKTSPRQNAGFIGGVLHVVRAGDSLDLAGEAPLGVEQQRTVAPVRFLSGHNFPNPFNPRTTIRFTLAERSKVRITVHSMLGQQVAALVDGEMAAGEHDVAFHAERYASGIYFARIWTADGLRIVRMVLMR
ncbi:MAG: Type 1 glutamine amidotransferase-like domain-containing protein [Bacteroidetes bacterium]|nr:Type 1 glutamine amidotransferase-like domain-containing protein [Bacteroidota bacterium]